MLCETLGIEEDALEAELEDIFAETLELTTSKNNGLIIRQPGEYEVSTGKQVIAGLADLLPFGHKTIKPLPKWMDEVLESPEKLQSSPSLCSSFSAKMTAVCLYAMNEYLVAEIREKHPEIKDDVQVLKLPFGKHEDLEKMHPTRLLKELQKRGAVKRVNINPLDELRDPSPSRG
jgi:hypothetical protein